ncbi:hypothetical protein CJ030_MR5G024999 [Morella rubra]|uniref:Uncharacterized protein n=1 Tax=Morella rubra TaxID=262757 RepID=A0A6A1VHJ6_9ROSI|nr:hypothetical protein CJ030_MR5G024999 [Morella rubra]
MPGSGRSRPITEGTDFPTCRQNLALNFLERETDRFSQFITECFTTYCKKKRREETRSMGIMWRSKPYVKCTIGLSIFIAIVQSLSTYFMETTTLTRLPYD